MAYNDNQHIPQKREVPKKEKPRAYRPVQAESSIATQDRFSRQASRLSSQGSRNRESANGGAQGNFTSARVGEVTGFHILFFTPKQSKLILLWASGILAFVLVVIVLLGILYRSDAFKIEYLSVQGVRHLTSLEVQDLAAVPDTTILRVDTDSIRERLLTDAWIADVEVNRIFPNTLELVITERSVFAVVEILNSDASSVILWAISSDGLWLMPIPDADSEAAKSISQAVYDDLETSLRITDVSYSVQPEIGTFCTGTTVQNAIEILSGMTTSLVDEIVSVDASSSVSLIMTLESGVEVDFGDATDIRTKERIVLELMEKYGNSVAYINVSSIENPTCRRA